MIVSLPPVEFAHFALADIPSNPEPFSLLNRVPIRDNGEPLVDLRETNPDLTFSDYCLPYVRASVAEALKAATRLVPEHLELRIFTALRTLDQQAEMYWGNYKRAQEQHPDWPKATVRRMTNRFFAPPDAKAPPGHCTGGAVDVGLLNRESGEGLDVRSPLDGWNAAPTAVQGLSPEAAENRRLLCFVMYSTGLSNCRDEFWHWSYGDSAWAVRVGQKTACYGLIEPSPEATRVIGGKVAVQAYNPEWPQQFETIRSGLSAVVIDIAKQIEHIGSTAVAGLSAKQILDIDIAVEDDQAMKPLIEALVKIGYEHQGDLGVAGREAFRLSRDGAFRDAPPQSWPKHHLYACLSDSLEFKRHLAFRDYLRRTSAAAARYGELKASLAARYPWDRSRYMDGKKPFIEEILRGIDSGLPPKPN